MDRNESWNPLETAAVAIHGAWGQVQVTGADVQEMQLYISGSEAEVNALRTQLTDGTLHVEQPVYGLSGMNVMESHWLTILLRVPFSWKGAVDLSTTSGRLSCRHMAGSDLKLETVNGTLEAEDLNFITAVLSTVSGTVRADRVECRELDIRTVSGSAGLEAGQADTIRLTSVTGDLRLNLSEAFGTIGATTVTGALNVEAPVTAVHVQRRAVAGNVQVWQAAQSESGPAVSMNTVSGDLEITGVAAE